MNWCGVERISYCTITHMSVYVASVFSLVRPHGCMSIRCITTGGI